MRLKYLNIKRVSNNWNRFFRLRDGGRDARGYPLARQKPGGNKNYCTKRKMETRTSAHARTHARTLNRGTPTDRSEERSSRKRGHKRTKCNAFSASSWCLRSKPQSSVSRNDHREVDARYFFVFCGVALSAVSKDFAKFDRKRASGFVLPRALARWYFLIKGELQSILQSIHLWFKLL